MTQLLKLKDMRILCVNNDIIFKMYLQDEYAT